MSEWTNERSVRARNAAPRPALPTRRTPHTARRLCARQPISVRPQIAALRAGECDFVFGDSDTMIHQVNDDTPSLFTPSRVHR